MRWPGTAASAMVAVLVGGCSTMSAVSPGASTDAVARFASDVRAAFPPSDFVIGVGHSPESLDAAEQSAKRHAASTLREELRSEFSTEERQDLGATGSPSYRSARSRLLAITTTNLTPYFRAVPELARHSAGSYLAVVVARRDALVERLTLEGDGHRALAMDAFARVLATRDLVGQAQAMCEARKAHAEASWRAMAIHLVLGRVVSHPELDASSRAAERAVAETRAALPVRVAFRGTDALLSGIAGRLSERVRATGLATEMGAVPDRKAPLRPGQVAIVLARTAACSQPAGAVFECRVNVKAEILAGPSTAVALMSVRGEPSAGRIMGPAPSAAEALAAAQFDSALFVDRATSQVVCLLSTRGCNP